MLCNICGQPAEPFAKAKVMGKYAVRYFQCTFCEFVQTEAPYWLDESYARVINESDIGLVGRNIRLAQLTFSLITAAFSFSGKFVDYGGGYGLFVRLMRDKGLRFYRYDPLCENLFAKPFDVEAANGETYELVTAFELFEHLAMPMDAIGKMLGYASSIFFSTTLLPPHKPKPGAWWYYGLDHGQHLSIFSQKTLAVIGEQLGLQLYSDGQTIHLLTDKSFSPLRFRLATHTKVSKVINSLCRRPSLIAEDYALISGRKLS